MAAITLLYILGFENMRKLYQISFLVFFMLILTLPMVKHLVSEVKIKSSENRNLAQKPVYPKSYADIEIFINKSDDYFSDQFGFRKNFIEAANRLKFYVFNEIASKQITVGRNDFIYFNSHGAKHPKSLIKAVCNINSLPKEFQAKTVSNITNYINQTRALGVKSEVAIIPTKARIYPEYLPKLENDWCKNNPPAWWENIFDHNPLLTVYYPLSKMLELKQSIQVYLPHHFHWHGKLPYVLAEDMMSSLWGISMMFDASTTDDRVQSDLKVHFKGVHFFDDSVKYDYSPLNIKKCEGHNCINGIEKFYKHNTSYVYKTNEYETNTKLVVLADSFGQYIAMNFIRGFSEVLVIDINNLSMDEQLGFHQWIMETVKPTHLLLLLHDGGIYGRTIKLERLMTDILNQK